jgi:hypothetical protein
MAAQSFGSVNLACRNTGFLPGIFPLGGNPICGPMRSGGGQHAAGEDLGLVADA